MTGLGERAHLLSPAIDLNMQITDVVQVLEFEDLRNIILVGHSYGGMIITSVADRATDRVGHIVYLDAAYPQNGQSLVDHAGPMMLAARAGARVVDGVELVLFPGEDPLGFFGVTDPQQIAWMRPRLTPHSWKCFEQKLLLSNEEAMRKIPETRIISTQNIDGGLHDSILSAWIFPVNDKTNTVGRVRSYRPPHSRHSRPSGMVKGCGDRNHKHRG
jgi:pimeloyl-ACP methyl ester carboxylesterase